ncbi:MAG: hypothetical protein KF901_11210 [Myxococcales bacterium]|nr:hypothetical protein [Myxococcales bacterium]
MLRTRHTSARCALVLVTLTLGCYGARETEELRDAGHVHADRDALVGRDTGLPSDAGLPPGLDGGLEGCDAEDARPMVCPELICDGPGTIHWDGEACVVIGCGECVGADCATSWPSLEECERAHAGCEPPLCRGTGGEWRFWAEDCGHWWCGFPPPFDCLVGGPVCDCGRGRRFEEGRGCVSIERECPTSEPVTREELCRGTGGAWEGICCDTECGRPCPFLCAQPACDCGPWRVFDEVRGCVEATRCFEPRLGERCGGRSRCEPGTFCDAESGECVRRDCPWDD